MEEIDPPKLLNKGYLLDDSYLDLENQAQVMRWKIKEGYKQMIEEVFQFTLEGICKKFGDQRIDCRLQQPNYDSFLPAQRNIRFKYQTIRDYFQYLDNPTQFLLRNKMDESNVLFAVNIDMENWEDLTYKFYELLPKSIKPKSIFDGLSYLRQQILGMNIPQCYIKTAGVWTGGHQENHSVQAINFNHGPGECIWYAVDAKYVDKVRKLVQEQFDVDIIKNEGLWFKSHQWFQDNQIPISKFIQKQGEFVYLDAGCLHWVSSLGKTLNTAWNFLHMNYNSFFEMSRRNLVNTKIQHPMIVPYFNLIFDIYIHGQNLSEKSQYFLWDQIKQKIEQERSYLNQKNFQIQYVNNAREVLMCSACKQEIFLYFYQHVQTESFYCLKCSRPRVLKIKAKYQEDIIQKILDKKQDLECSIDLCSVYTGATTCKVQQELKDLYAKQLTLRTQHPKEKMMKVSDVFQSEEKENDAEVQKKLTRQQLIKAGSEIVLKEELKSDLNKTKFQKSAGRPKKIDQQNQNTLWQPQQPIKIENKKINKIQPSLIKSQQEAKIAHNLKQHVLKKSFIKKSLNQLSSSSEKISATSYLESSQSKQEIIHQKRSQNQELDYVLKYFKKKLNNQKVYFKYQIQALRQRLKKQNRIQLQSTKIQEEQQIQIDELMSRFSKVDDQSLNKTSEEQIIDIKNNNIIKQDQIEEQENIEIVQYNQNDELKGKVINQIPEISIPQFEDSFQQIKMQQNELKFQNDIQQGDQEKQKLDFSESPKLKEIDSQNNEQAQRIQPTSEDDHQSENSIERQRRLQEQLIAEESKQEYLKLLEAAQKQKQSNQQPRKQSTQDQTSGSPQDQKSSQQDEFSFGVSIQKSDGPYIDEQTPSFDPKSEQATSNSPIDEQMNHLIINLDNKDDQYFQIKNIESDEKPKEIPQHPNQNNEIIHDSNNQRKKKRVSKRKSQLRKNGSLGFVNIKANKIDRKNKNIQMQSEISIVQDENNEISSIVIEQKEETSGDRDSQKQDNKHQKGSKNQSELEFSNNRCRSWKMMQRQQSQVNLRNSIQSDRQSRQIQTQQMGKQQDANSKEIEETEKIEKKRQSSLVRLKQIDD